MFPFGIVSLAAGTSEGHSANMPNFRHAQTASYGFLPGPEGSGMENTFIAQGYDAGDPGTHSILVLGRGESFLSFHLFGRCQDLKLSATSQRQLTITRV